MQRHFHDGDQKISPFGQSLRLQQRLFFGNVEWTDGRQRVHNLLIARLFNLRPVRLKTHDTEILFHHIQQLFPVGDPVIRRFQIISKATPVNRRTAIATIGQLFRLQGEPADASQGNHVPSVSTFLKIADPSSTADIKQGTLIIKRLHHANHPFRRLQRILNHCQITWFKNIQWQL